MVILTGETGCGKSRFAHRISKELYPHSTYYKPRGEWWDGYEQHKLVIMDDFYGWIKYDELLKICDRYPYRVPVKGGFRQFNAECIILTSNSEPEGWYKFDHYHGGSALIRRNYLSYFGLERGGVSPESEDLMVQHLRSKLAELGHDLSSKYHATAGCNEQAFLVEVLLRRGFEPPTFRFTNQAARPTSLSITPQCHDN